MEFEDRATNDSQKILNIKKLSLNLEMSGFGD